MNLVIALKSGLPFKRSIDNRWWQVNSNGWILNESGDFLSPTKANIMALDWEVQEEETTITITKEQLHGAIHGGDVCWNGSDSDITDCIWHGLQGERVK